MKFQDGAMAAILFFQKAPISKETYPRWCPTIMLSFKSIGRSVFELESGNQNVDEQTDGWHRTHQSNRRIGYMQPTPQKCLSV